MLRVIFHIEMMCWHRLGETNSFSQATFFQLKSSIKPSFPEIATYVVATVARETLKIGLVLESYDIT